MTREQIKWLLRLMLALTLCVTLTVYYIVGYPSRTVLSSSLLPQGVETENKLVESVLKSSGESANKSAPQERKTNVNVLVTSTRLAINHTMNAQSLGRSFMLSLVYAEQLTNAFAHYNEFLILASLLNFTGVEPFVKNSRMFGVRGLTPDPHLCFDLRLLLNMESFNSKLSTCFRKRESNKLDTPYMIKPMEDFLKHSYRKVVVVYFSRHTRVLSHDIHKSMDSALDSLFLKHQDEPIVSCKDIANKKLLTRRVELLLNKERYREANMSAGLDIGNFTVQDVFCVNTVPLSLVRLIDHLRAYLNTTLSHVSILFVSWQGKFTREFTDWRTFDFHCKLPFTQVELSEKVHHFADRFHQSVGLYKQDFISVHIRFEKLFQFAYGERKDSQEKFYTCCMRRLELLLELLAKKNNLPLNNTLLLKDYGGFGTDSCRYQGRWSPHYLCEEQMNKSLALLNVSASEFNPRIFKGAPDNSGFASLVEEASLFSGKVIVAVGGGGYQAGVVSRYIDWHRNSTYTANELHYQLCINEKLNGLELDHQTC